VTDELRASLVEVRDAVDMQTPPDLEPALDRISRIISLLREAAFMAATETEENTDAHRKGQKRPADLIGNAIKVARIATGEEEEEYEAKPPKDEAAASLAERAVRRGPRA
jgi:uncharacterized protein (DUF1800 family)